MKPSNLMSASDHAARGPPVPREGELRAAEPHEQRRAAHRLAGRQDLVQQGGGAAEVLPAQAARGRPPHGAADRGHAGDAGREAGQEPQEAARDPSATRQGDGQWEPHGAEDGPRAGPQARLEAEGEEGGRRQQRQAAGCASAQDGHQDAAEAGGDQLVHLARR
ncbi:hypothetical protein ON010_g4415 [Phytophthora cinnamomi]|nr:hypothetical protein ON010_g4415 [Phytophthora cinnamomi]